jgi:hypothetical protein
MVVLITREEVERKKELRNVERTLKGSVTSWIDSNPRPGKQGGG